MREKLKEEIRTPTPTSTMEEMNNWRQNLKNTVDEIVWASDKETALRILETFECDVETRTAESAKRELKEVGTLFGFRVLVDKDMPEDKIKWMEARFTPREKTEKELKEEAYHSLQPDKQ